MKAAYTFLTFFLLGSLRASQAEVPAEPSLPAMFGKNAEVVVYARVLDSHSSVRAGPNQAYVDKNQGWAAIKIEIKKVSKGEFAGKTAWIANVQVLSVWPKYVRDYPEGAYFHFALRRSQDLSKWCETDVFELSEMSPDTLSKEANQSPEPAPGAVH